MAWTTKYRNEIVLLVAIFAVIAFTFVADDAYRTDAWGNFKNISQQVGLLGIFSLGAAIVIISGGIDLSSGSVIAFGGTVCALTMMACAPTNELGKPIVTEIGSLAVVIAIGATILMGFMVGTLHAWLITVIRLPPFIATLGSLVGLRSLAKVVSPAVSEQLGSRANTVRADAEVFEAIDQWWVAPTTFLVLSAACYVLMNHTIWGRHLYALGGNEEAAKLSGIRTDRMKWLAYCIGAITASIAAVLYLAMTGSADPAKTAMGYELNGIAAAVVGGCSLSGGIGLIPGVILGATFLRVVIDSIKKVVERGSDDYEGMIVGFLVVLAVAINEFSRQGHGNRRALFAGALGLSVIFVLAVLTGTVLFVMSGVTAGLTTGCSVLAILFAWKIFEARSAS